MHPHWLIYVVAFFTLIFAVCLLIRLTMVLVTVEQNSMSPTLEEGDRVLALRAFPSSRVKNGQIVIVWPWALPPDGPAPFGVKSPYIKRILGMPGDTLVTTLADLNDHYRPRQAPEHDAEGNRTWHIPAGHCFVRGDNPIGGYDSLTWGPIPLRSVLGIVIKKLPRREYTAPPPPYRTLPLGQIGPEFAARTLDGEVVTSGTLTQKAVMIVFIAPNPPSRQMLPGIEEARTAALRAGVEIVLVSIVDSEQTKAFRDELGLRCRILVAPRETNPFVSHYNVPGTPFYTYINDQGLVQSTGYPNRKFPEWNDLLTSWGVTEPEGWVAHAI